jgi:hypothetical protein
MATRIRYKETANSGIFESVQVFTNKQGIKYRVRIDTNEMVYAIINVKRGNLIKGGDAINNLNFLKQAARARLESLGVELTRASRDRTFGLCEKGKTQDKHEKDNG